MEQLFQQLRHPDPAVRRATIIEIGKRGDPRALKALKYVHQNDPDPQLRELAYKAGAHIAKQQKAQQSEPPPPPPPPQNDPEPEGDQTFKWYGNLFEEEDQQKSQEPQFQKVEVSPQDEERAKVLLSRAMDYYMRENRPKAADNLSKALNLNPNLRKDPVANGLAQDITGFFGQFAFDAILKKDTRKNMFAADRQRQSQERFAETAEDITTVSVYLILYLAFVALGFMIIFILTYKVSADTWSDVYDYNSSTVDVSYPALFISAIIFSIVNTFFVVLLGFSIHLVARGMFIGSGSMLGFMKRQIPFVGAGMLGYFVLDSMYTLSPETIMLACFGLVFGLFIFLYLFAGEVAKYYNLGTIGGCAATIIGLIVFGGLNILGLYLILYLIFSSAS